MSLTRNTLWPWMRSLGSASNLLSGRDCQLLDDLTKLRTLLTIYYGMIDVNETIFTSSII